MLKLTAVAKFFQILDCVLLNSQLSFWQQFSILFAFRLFVLHLLTIDQVIVCDCILKLFLSGLNKYKELVDLLSNLRFQREDGRS